MFPNIQIFEYKIPSFNIIVAVAFLIGILSFLKSTKNVLSGSLQDEMLAIIGYDIPFIIAGAIIHNKISFSSSIEEFKVNLLKNTGFAFWGGLLGGAIGLLILYHFFIGSKYSFYDMVNLMTPHIVLGHSIGRIGCLMGGCCFGKPSILGVYYSKGTPAYEMYGDVRIFPVSLLESVVLFLLYLYLNRTQYKDTAKIYLCLYSVYRFLAEFIRGDIRGNGYILSPAQKICIIIFLVVNVYSMYNKKHILHIK